MGGPQLPDVGNCGNADVPDELRNPWVPDDFDFRPDYPVTPGNVETDEIQRTLGDAASLARSSQLLRNQGLRFRNSERNRYAKIAARINLYRAAEDIAQRKLAPEHAAQEPVSPSLGDSVGDIVECPAPPVVGGVETPLRLPPPPPRSGPSPLHPATSRKQRREPSPN